MQSKKNVTSIAQGEESNVTASLWCGVQTDVAVQGKYKDPMHNVG
jgi:hypothetical protein